ncbi:MAG: 3-isopropylmalate dehydratase large subunit [Betaproteobacteria bacterium]|nr:3-isopropylmalate dehydratase large subunit [Betaproteobacteria bacterium]NBU49231.1 3-isopropylmalate dehydratase large subunit [Betaproteobacteria bacterium]
MASSLPRTLVHKIWQQHLVAELDHARSLLHIDRVFLHERTGPALLTGLAHAGRPPRHPHRVVGITDHIVSTLPDRLQRPDGPLSEGFIREFAQRTAQAGIPLIDLHDPRQGIVHVVAAEQGWALPGMTIVCPDSHTGTLGGLGALAWGIGSTEGEQAVATHTLVRPRPSSMRVRLEGRLPDGVTAKDMILALIAREGARGGQGCAVEFCGPAVQSLSMEGRMTLCNMAVEFGAWTGLVAPDDATIEWVANRPGAPVGANWERAVQAWRHLVSDDLAHWDSELRMDVGHLEPQVTWGSSVELGGGISQPVPDPAQAESATRRALMERALNYMDLRPGMTLKGIPIDAAFIGSCTNSRLPDLRAAAAVVRGRHVAPGVRAIVVPGSMPTRAAAEAEGLHRIFQDAGFEWRASGCSLCFYSGAEDLGPVRRVISSTNRNFEGRQGPGVRTHLASPATVAASAVAGCIADPRPLLTRAA